MKKDFLYIHVPRTGGSSLWKIIYSVPGMSGLGHNIREDKFVYLKDYVKTLDKKPFIFCFIRNPFDRLVSSFFYLDKDGNGYPDAIDRQVYISKFDGSFERFVKEGLRNDPKFFFNQIHFKPQAEYICDSKNNLIPDYIAKFEDYENELKILSEKLNFNLVDKVLHINSSKHKPYKDYYDKEMIGIVYEAYKKDFLMSDYVF